MRYLADILTLTRFVLAIILFLLAGLGGTPEAAFIIFLVAELTDVFDGTCSRKWPFPKNQIPKYRKYAAKFDMFADILLAGAQVLFLTLRVNSVLGLGIIIYYFVTAGGGDLWVYGKVVGHPDDCRKNSLIHRNFPLAKKIILARRYLYVACLGLVNVVILFSTGWSTLVKIILVILGCACFVFAWFFLSQRRQHISRDAVELEKTFAATAKKSRRHKA